MNHNNHWGLGLRLIYFIIFSALSLFGAYSVAQAADVKKYLYLPSFQIVETQNFTTLQINQRIIIRLQRTSGARRASFSSRNGGTKVKLEERKIGKCIAMDNLAGFAPGPKDSLEFITKDRKLIRAYLADNCKAKEFYAGAYIEKSKDGKLCQKRDIVHARYGAECALDRFRQLVPETS